MSSKWDKFVELLENPLSSGVFLTVVLVLAFYFAYGVWIYVYTAFLTYFIADSIVKVLISGGGGIFQFRLNGSETIPRGHAFLFFTGVIVFSTYISAKLSEFIIKVYQIDGSNIWSVIGAVVAILLVVSLNMYLTYFQRKKQNK